MTADKEMPLQEGFWQAVLRDSAEGMTVFSSEGECIWANESAARIVGVSLDRIVGSSLDEGNPLGLSLAEDVDTSKKDGRPVAREFKVGGDQSQARWAHRVTQVASLDGNTYTVITLEDITERKEAENELRLAKNSVEHAQDMIFWLDSEGQMIFANDAMCERLGYDPRTSS